MKILNLYAGVGGNRMLWGDEHEITAVELNESVASCYKRLHPNDNVVAEHRTPEQMLMIMRGLE